MYTAVASLLLPFISHRMAVSLRQQRKEKYGEVTQCCLSMWLKYMASSTWHDIIPETEFVLHAACQTNGFQTTDHKIMMVTWERWAQYSSRWSRACCCFSTVQDEMIYLCQYIHLCLWNLCMEANNDYKYLNLMSHWMLSVRVQKIQMEKWSAQVWLLILGFPDELISWILVSEFE